MSTHASTGARASGAAALDTMTAEVVRYGLAAVVDEMKSIIVYSAYTPLLVEVEDFSVGLVDLNHETYASATGIANFSGCFAFAIAEAERRLGEFEEGDVIVTNDPYTTGTHLSDVTLIAPVFAAGSLVSFALSTAHWIDMGGAGVGGWFTDSRSVHEEGILIPYSKLYARGHLNQEVQDLILANVRDAEMCLGDLRAQVASVQRAQERLVALVDRYGLSTVFGVIATINDRAEAAARAALAELPDGDYSAESYCDGDGVVDKPVPVKVAIHKHGDEVTVDLEGCGPQNVGPLNHGWPLTVGCVRQVFKAIVDPYSPLSDGTFRPLEVKLPRKTFLSAEYPAPVGCHCIANATVMDTILLALKPMLASRTAEGALPVAGSYADVCPTFLGGVQGTDGGWWVHGEPQAGGWGANALEDGQTALIQFLDGDTKNVPIEKIERLFPLLVEEYRLREDSGGPGRNRGGLGTVKAYRVAADDVEGTFCYERSKLPPWGIDGGSSGRSNRVEFDSVSGEVRRMQKVSKIAVARNSVVRCMSGGGGGFGSPLEREPERVLEDVRLGYVSCAAALAHYGVVIEGDAVDGAATNRVRSERAA